MSRSLQWHWFCLVVFMQVIYHILLNMPFVHLENDDNLGSLPLKPPLTITYEPQHEISNNVVCATSKASDQPVHTHSLIRTFASRLNIL